MFPRSPAPNVFSQNPFQKPFLPQQHQFPRLNPFMRHQFRPPFGQPNTNNPFNKQPQQPANANPPKPEPMSVQSRVRTGQHRWNQNHNQQGQPYPRPQFYPRPQLKVQELFNCEQEEEEYTQNYDDYASAHPDYAEGPTYYPQYEMEEFSVESVEPTEETSDFMKIASTKDVT